MGKGSIEKRVEIRDKIGDDVEISHQFRKLKGLILLSNIPKT